MKKLSILTVILLIAYHGSAQQVASLFYEPSLSPDGTEIAFVSGGDIWTVPVSGGEARLLIAQEGTESRPLYSPDGKSMAFSSARTGNGDVYVFNFSTGDVQRLTFDDAAEEVSAWSPDSRFIYFSSTGHDISGMADVFRVPALGGTPMAVLEEPYTNEYFATPSPDGSAIVFSARGVASRQWWREGHSHLDESEIWLWKEKNNQLQKLTNRGAKEIWPMWNADGSAIFFMSDRDGHENLWTKPISGDAKQLTKFADGRVLWPSISRNGSTIVFERNFQIWKYEVGSGKASQVTISKRGAQPVAAVEHVKLTNQFNNLALSPDGKKVAFIARGEIFAASVKDGGDAARITNSPEAEEQPIWSPDSKKVVYVLNDGATSSLYEYTFSTQARRKLTNSGERDESPVFSHDGKSIAFTRNGKELHIYDVATGKDRTVAKGYFGRGPFSSSNTLAWSSDDKWIAYASFGHKTFRNVFVVPAAGGESMQVSFLSNTFGGRIEWTGKSIFFVTQQRTEDGLVARIDLVPRTPVFQEDKFSDLFVDPIPADRKITPPAKTTGTSKDTLVAKTNFPAAIQFADIARRLNFLPIGMDVDDIRISHDGKTLLLIATVAGQSNLYTYSLDESSKEPPVAKQITSTAGQKSNPQFTADDKEVIYLERGTVYKATIESRQAKPIDIAAELNVDFAVQKNAVFQQAWNIQNDFFYDSLHHGSNWRNVLKQYEPLALASKTPDELRRVISQMLGELNASHSGISAPASQNVTVDARTGLRFDRTEYEKSGKLKVTSVIALSPADVSGGIHAGDYVLAVDDTVLTRDMNFDRLLLNKIGKRTRLAVSSSGLAKDSKIVALMPVNQTTEKRLLYRQWVNQQREYVKKASGGRLGYVHMLDMSAESLNQLYMDLDAENHARDGVVVDVRNNNGGFVNAYALDVLSRKGYMTMTVRGLPSAPARTQLGQRALELPTVLVTNQHSLSDAEDFTEGYRALGLGKVVGEPTAGWIIYTSSATLVDGSVMRLPFIRVTDHEGKNMELNPRKVDVAVSRDLGESAQNKDAQLDVAVKTLLDQLGTSKPAPVNLKAK
ncbi:MAG TPA: LpqB family beta-propeller domain-containing protein [Cyclobacteriaceae bacterium]|nr:LpqB family beta-propeller domain-containing protein [Cyclobacteriaceae bacterium]